LKGKKDFSPRKTGGRRLTRGLGFLSNHMEKNASLWCNGKDIEMGGRVKE